MSLSAAEKTAIIASVQDLTDKVSALVVDPAVNPLQPLLDAALVERDAAQANVVTLQGKIDAAKTAIQAVAAADAIEDQKRADALAALE